MERVPRWTVSIRQAVSCLLIWVRASCVTLIALFRQKAGFKTNGSVLLQISGIDCDGSLPEPGLSKAAPSLKEP